jgi:hypothetical protein
MSQLLAREVCFVFTVISASITVHDAPALLTVVLMLMGYTDHIRISNRRWPQLGACYWE